MDTFVESSWYFDRFACADYHEGPLDRKKVDYWMPVDQYIGGIEHAILHLMYFRFYHRLLRDAGMVEGNEPATRLLCQGMVVADTYYREGEDGSVHWINPAEVEVTRDAKGKALGATLRSDGGAVTVGAVEKMSKSKNNGVDPQGLVERYGADCVRLFSMFAAPPDQSLEWSDSGVEGASRFLRRIWNQVMQHVGGGSCDVLDPGALNPDQREMRRLVHDTIFKVSDDIARRYTFNTAIAAIMELSNKLAKFGDSSGQGRAVRQEACSAVVRMLNPVTPHICEVLWTALGESGPLYAAPWPVASESARVRAQVTLVVQVNGKVRARLEVEPGLPQESVLRLALELENVRKHLEGKSVRKVVHVPERLLNIVVG
jgi:leucyl-tRNA synthetase